MQQTQKRAGHCYHKGAVLQQKKNVENLKDKLKPTQTMTNANKQLTCSHSWLRLASTKRNEPNLVCKAERSWRRGRYLRKYVRGAMTTQTVRRSFEEMGWFFDFVFYWINFNLLNSFGMHFLPSHESNFFFDNSYSFKSKIKCGLRIWLNAVSFWLLKSSPVKSPG